MSNTKKTKKNQKKNKKAKFNFKEFWDKNKKLLIIILCALVLAGGVAGVISIIMNKKHANEINVAFYNIPDEVTALLSDEINKRFADTKNVNFVQLGEKDFSPSRIGRKYDLYFGWDGSAVELLEVFAERIPGECYSLLNTSLRKSNGKTVPVLLDHYEIDYHTKTLEAFGEYPETMIEMQEYLKKAKEYVFSPFFTNGADDKMLLGFISAMTETLGGYDSYMELIKALKKKPKLSEVIDMELSGDFTLREELDMLRSWSEDGLVHPNWSSAKFGDVKAFLEDDQVAVLFTSLSKHREISYNSISKFTTDRIPVFSTTVDHGLMAPAIVGLKLSNKKGLDEFFKDLLGVQLQGQLSKVSKLAPAASRGSAFDRQADDVRFLAAGCKYGPTPDIYNALFQTDTEGAKVLAEEFRNYLKYGALTK